MAAPGPLGVHLQLGKGYEKALAEADRLGITCVQFFTHNPRGWQFAPLKEEEVQAFVAGLEERAISPVASHCNYLINLGTRDAEIRRKSLDCLRQEFAYADAFGCDFFVLHVGKHKEEGLAQGIANVVEGINSIKETMRRYPGITLLLETVSGQGSEIGRELKTFREIIEGIDEEIRGRIGVCLDSCHVFAAGYDLRTRERVDFLVKELEETVGLDRLRLIHLNDSLKGLGERRDRHVHIGEGHIGEEGFRAFLTHPWIAPIPKVLETPDDGTTGDLENLERVRRLQK